MFGLRPNRKAIWSCPYCDLKIRNVDDLDVAVIHLWEEHRHPARIEINGTVLSAGPQFPPLKWLLKRLAK